MPRTCLLFPGSNECLEHTKALEEQTACKAADGPPSLRLRFNSPKSRLSRENHRPICDQPGPIMLLDIGLYHGKLRPTCVPQSHPSRQSQVYQSISQF